VLKRGTVVTFRFEKCLPKGLLRQLGTSLVCQSFKFCRGKVAKRAVPALAIVEAFNVAKDLALGLVSGGEAPPIDTLNFEGAEERFDCGVIVTRALAAHAGHQPMSFEQLPVGPAGVLDTTIGMMEQPLGGPAMPQRHLQD